MFQQFEVLTDPRNGPIRLAALRQELKACGLTGFLVPHADEHQGEYLPARAERLSWLTGFTASAGAAIVLETSAAVFYDGRYTLQVRQQVDTDAFTPVFLAETRPEEWLAKNVKEGDRIGFDPWLHTAAEVDRVRRALAEKGVAELVPVDVNPIDTVWDDQPDAPLGDITPHPAELAGLSSEQKRLQISEILSSKGEDAAILTLPDSIAWLLNIRGSDLPHTPFPLSFAILDREGRVDFFVDDRKLTPETRTHLGNAINVRAPEDFVPALADLNGKTVHLDDKTAAERIRMALKDAGAEISAGQDPCLLPKACKNPAEQEGMRQAHIRDGHAVAKFLSFMAKEAAKGELDEISAAKKLEAIRAENGALKDLSFDTISGAGPNGALPHYRVNTASNRSIKSGELYLVDSGGQYADGTTDITRTSAVGEPTDEMRDRFTRVLKGHIGLAMARFPAGTRGCHLDILARQPLWEAGLDFDHGTGHGVGAHLSVHEGPQNISKGLVDVALREGMICSNEPGFYKEGEYGIRIENLVIVTPAEALPGGERPMHAFETITLAPIDLNLVEPRLLTDAERTWLNDYHKRVFDTLAPEADADTKAWLEEATRVI
jgi:Xaa-Pro aminopeptidase